MPQRGLGRGLASLIPDSKNNQDNNKDAAINSQAQKMWGGSTAQKVTVTADRGDTPKATSSAAAPENAIVEIAIDAIVANPYQPRKKFEEQALKDLTDSIATHGILQPLVVVPRGDGYELIAGERRFRASQLAGRTTVPVIVRDVEKQEQLELSLIENIQRQNLNPIEEALSFQQLAEEFDLSQEAVAKRVGKSRSSVANTLRLLHLPEEVQTYIQEGKLTEGHGKVLLELDSPQKQIALAKKIIRQSMTVKDTSATIKVEKGAAPRSAAEPTQDNPHLKTWEQKLASILGTKVTIKDAQGKGVVSIEYFSEEERAALFEKLAGIDDLN